MKIDNQRNIISIDSKKVSKKITPETDSTKASSADSVDSRLSSALKGAVEGIQNSGLTAGEIHSRVDETRASGLLKSSDIDSSRPRLADKDLLAMADRVAAASQKDPQMASNAFNELDPGRVAELTR